jgi:hypothetical protein
LYAHWDLTPEQQRYYCGLSTDRYLLLRVHQDSERGQLVAELRIHPETHHSFINVDAPARKYVAELGYLPANGSWNSIATSDAATTPLEIVPPKEPVQFATMTFAPLQPAQETPVKPEIRPGPIAPLILHAIEAKSPILELSIPKLPQMSFGEWADALEQEAVIPQFEGPIDKPGVAWTVTNAVPERTWTPAHERALAEIIGLTLIKSRCLGSQEIEELSRGPGLPGQREFSLIEAALVQGLVSSGAMGELQPTGYQGFWFNVNAELVIYGATESNATVLIGGRPIRLRPDGTFSYRFALPDGSYHLPLTAISSRGDMRQAELDFHRSTAFSGEVRAHPQDPQLKEPKAENVA